MRCRWVEAIVVVGAVVCLFERYIVHPVRSRHVGSGSFWDGKAFIFMEISWGWHACMHALYRIWITCDRDVVFGIAGQ
jgi:hypothetical protein